MITGKGSPDIILVLHSGCEIREPDPVAGYSVRSLPRALDPWWIDIDRKSVPGFARADLQIRLERYRSLSLTEGILVATHDATQEPVTTAGSIANSKDGMFPDWGQLAWVVTIVSGGGIEFMRPWAETVHGIPPEQVIGSSIKTEFEMRDGIPVLVRLPEINFIDDKAGKPVAINQHIGRRPPDAPVGSCR